MPVSLQQTSTVVLGAWNPAILHPTWLSKHRIVRELPVAVPIGFHTLLRRRRFSLDGFDWEVDQTRLAITSTAGSNSGECAAKVLKILCHTPVEGIGHNFVYRSSARDWPERYLPRLGDMRVGKRSSRRVFEQAQWVGHRNLDDSTRLQILVSQEADGGVVAAFNFHRNVSEAPEAHKFAKKWRADRDISAKLLRSTFKVRYSCPK